MLNWKRLGLAGGLSLTLLVAGCGDADTDGDATEGDTTEGETAGEETTDEATTNEEGGEIELVYVEWDSEVASTHVIGQVLADQGYDVTLTPIDNAIMWQSVANGEADGMVAAWLPATHGDLYEEYSDSLVDLGTNLEGAKIGLVVPSYMTIDSIEDLDQYADELGSTITGIEPGAGVVQAAETAVDEDYANLDGWDVQTSSSGAMAQALGEAVNNEEPIVVTGWTPHWKFASYDLKYLDDPQGSFGEAEYIATMVREGLQEDLPGAYQILDQFNWTAADMEEVMLDIQEGASAEDAAAAWIEANEEKVAEWVAGVE
ncbi:glycine betaine ABC transporter substrate-binding protein [Evansella cellulosilytica]|uniref:Substrate-binding region of ABC-type glycine betaine transport system n=1 Tax=Evansella cellulosilytica (strain ATCC 21833 / DSM 2522 / FERM P-1141 / JCM 9156 / N-4) TaxID=649639 RepID=E6TV25_EVAC2|nr:glycine betaine ABC transporter substrate-binding protein [Evansella cellulosilytica]ADU28608.1 Substrate-binding region of ABC-type glycine betaine transport system [Evansella cellulosilytica DSM 2522]